MDGVRNLRLHPDTPTAAKPQRHQEASGVFWNIRCGQFSLFLKTGSWDNPVILFATASPFPSHFAHRLRRLTQILDRPRRCQTVLRARSILRFYNAKSQRRKEAMELQSSPLRQGEVLAVRRPGTAESGIRAEIKVSTRMPDSAACASAGLASLLPFFGGVWRGRTDVPLVRRTVRRLAGTNACIRGR